MRNLNKAIFSVFCGWWTLLGWPALAGSTMTEARRALAGAELHGGKVGDIDLRGYNFHQEFSLGQSGTGIAISCQGGGGFALFAKDGTLISTARTEEIGWVQLVDLDEDGTPEILTEETTQYGTGILVKEFVLYRVTQRKLTPAWRAESLYSSAQWKPGQAASGITERRSFVRFDSLDGVPLLRYLRVAQDGSKRETTYRPTKDGSLEAVP